MAQKYPNNELPYRLRRRPLRTCCVSKRGIVKQFWVGEDGAREFITDKSLEAVLEPYPCRQHEGNWHVRSLRK